MPALAVVAFQGSPLWNFTPWRRVKSQLRPSTCSHFSTPESVTTSKVSLVIQVMGSLTISLHTAVSRVALQVGFQGSTLPGSAVITITISSLPTIALSGAACCWRTAVGWATDCWGSWARGAAAGASDWGAAAEPQATTTSSARVIGIRNRAFKLSPLTLIIRITSLSKSDGPFGIHALAPKQALPAGRR